MLVTCSKCSVQFDGARYRIGGKVYCAPCGDALTAKPEINLEFNPQGQMFASRETIRAAIFDVIDHGDEDDQPWMFYENTGPLSTYDQSQADFDRARFVDDVIKRCLDLQASPHDGIKLENLCDFHKRRALPVPTSQSCAVCEKERKVKA